MQLTSRHALLHAFTLIMSMTWTLIPAESETTCTFLFFQVGGARRKARGAKWCPRARRWLRNVTVEHFVDTCTKANVVSVTDRNVPASETVPWQRPASTRPRPANATSAHTPLRNITEYKIAKNLHWKFYFSLRFIRAELSARTALRLGVARDSMSIPYVLFPHRRHIFHCLCLKHYKWCVRSFEYPMIYYFNIFNFTSNVKRVAPGPILAYV